LGSFNLKFEGYISRIPCQIQLLYLWGFFIESSSIFDKIVPEEMEKLMSQQRPFWQQVSNFFDDYPWVFGALMFGIGIIAGGAVMLLQINFVSGTAPAEEQALQAETIIVTRTSLPSATQVPEATPTPAFTPTFTPFQPIPTLEATQSLATQQSSLGISFPDNVFHLLFCFCSRIVLRSLST